jgi:tetratricopeptide (TPR) repeat protein
MRVFRLFGPAIALALPFSATALSAQTQMVQPLSPLGDELAAEMRLLAANPLDINALVRAGELALKLGDTTAAATFFARAEKLDPRNARIKAGMGSLLVQAERPGEALRRFGEAEALGLDPRNYAADRGLAYDLIGQQERAQRDYRLALKQGPADETIRRYALSLGISGKRDMALQQLDPLVRRSDRGAWRARAFILAMNGDDQGASRIATNMMPPGLAQGLQPFFERLPSLGPTDRAFAVHFGELRATPERIADARMIPALAPLAPEPGMPVATVAVVQAPPARVEKQDDRRGRRQKRDRQDAIRVATTPPPQPQPQPQPLPQPPTYVASANTAAQPIYTAPTRAPDTARQSMTLMPAPERQGVTAVPPNTPPSALESTIGAQGRGPATSPVQQSASRPASPPPSTSSPVVPASPPLAGAPRVAVATPAAGGNPSAGALGPAISGASPQPSTGAVVAASAPAAGPPDEPASATSGAAPLPESPRVAAIASAPPPSAPTPTPMRSEDSILASIIANIAVPGSELDVAPVETARTEPRAAAASPRVEPQPVDTGAAAREAAEKQALADRKALADKKAAEVKKLADAKKLAEARKAAELKKKNDPKILEPARIWVQVAGGANEATLPKEWEKVRSRAPAAFKGKSGWTTPLRATNRVLAGPFKTNDEARAFVNALAKEGISAFTFASEAGQKVAKLAVK